MQFTRQSRLIFLWPPAMLSITHGIFRLRRISRSLGYSPQHQDSRCRRMNMHFQQPCATSCDQLTSTTHRAYFLSFMPVVCFNLTCWRSSFHVTHFTGESPRKSCSILAVLSQLLVFLSLLRLPSQSKPSIQPRVWAAWTSDCELLDATSLSLAI